MSWDEIDKVSEVIQAGAEAAQAGMPPAQPPMQ